MRKLKYVILWMLLLCLMACQRKEADKDVLETETLSPGSYYVYYLEQSGYRLQGEVVMLESNVPATLARELVDAMQSPKPGKYSSVLPVDMHIISIKYEGGSQLLSVDFTEEYNNQTPEREILSRAALVWTLTGISGVEQVSITVDGVALKDSMGNQVGNLKASDFDAEVTGGTRYATITLYFTDASGMMLVEEIREVSYSKEKPLSMVVMEELIRGPQTEGAYPVLVPGLQVQDIVIRDGVCYLYFDEAFLNNTLVVKDRIPIYAVVNSMVELNDVTKVQFVIDNSYDAVFRDTVPLSGLFERNLDLVQEP